MDMNAAVALGRQCLMAALLIMAPLLGVGLVVGIVIALLQAVTSIQEQTLTMVPKILAVAAAVFLLMPWILRQITGFALEMLQNLGRYGVRM
jgi:flagellar biosynthetic protein FliQ